MHPTPSDGRALCPLARIALGALLSLELAAQVQAPVKPRALAPAAAVALDRQPSGGAWVAASPGGRWLTACFQDTTWVWQAHTGALVKLWEDRDRGIGFTRDDAWAAVWDPSGTWLEVWDWQQRRPVRRLGPFPRGQSLSEPALLAGEGRSELWLRQYLGDWAVNDGRPVRLTGWDLATGRSLGDLEPPGPVCGGPAFGEGRMALVLRDPDRLALWHTRDHRLERTVNLDPPGLPAMGSHPHQSLDGQHVASLAITAGCARVALWWYPDGSGTSVRRAQELVLPLLGGAGTWREVAPPPVPRPAQGVPEDALRVVADLRTGGLKPVLGSNREPDTIQVNQAGQRVTPPWDERYPRTFEGRTFLSTGLLPLPARGILLNAGSDGCLRVRDLRTGRIDGTFPVPGAGRVTAYSEEDVLRPVLGGKAILWGRKSGQVFLFDLDSRRYIAQLGEDRTCPDPGDGLMDDSQALTSGPLDLVLWDLRSLRRLHVWERANRAAVSPDGRLLAIQFMNLETGWPDRLEIWDRRALQWLGRIKPEGVLTDFRFTADSRSLALVARIETSAALAAGLSPWGGSAPADTTVEASRWSLERQPRMLEKSQAKQRNARVAWTPGGFTLAPPSPGPWPAAAAARVILAPDRRFRLDVSAQSRLVLSDTATRREWDLGEEQHPGEQFLFLGDALVGLSRHRFRKWVLADLSW